MDFIHQTAKLFKTKESQDMGIKAPGNFFPFNQWVKNFGLKVESKNPGNAVPPIANPEEKPVDPPVNSEDDIQNILIKSPQMSATAFVQWCKSMGYSISKAPSVSASSDAVANEADSGSTLTATQREALSFAGGAFTMRARFLESVGTDTPSGYTSYKCVLLEEGMGNLRDGFYYTREAIKGANVAFEGKKIYADHPSKIEEETRPERSVRDVLGYFQDVTMEEGEDGQALLVGNVHMFADPEYAWARALMREAYEYSKKFPGQDLIGLSINASGEAHTLSVDEFLSKHPVPASAAKKVSEAVAAGLQNVKLVSKLDSAISCDMVTEAGAKGRVIQPLK